MPTLHFTQLLSFVLLFIPLLIIYRSFRRIRLMEWRKQLTRNQAVRFFYSGKWYTGKIECFRFNDTNVLIRFTYTGIKTQICLPKKAILPIK